MFEFDPKRYGRLVSSLWSPEPLPALGPGARRKELKTALAEASLDELFAPNEIVDRDAAMGCLSGLWLWSNFLDESHSISQEIHTPSGSFWHGIMHRREPDYGNAKYWFRQVGRHPIYPRLAQEAAELVAKSEFKSTATRHWKAGETWDAPGFVDLCEAASRNADLRPLCEQIAAVEWQLLFDHDWHAAVGK